MRPRMRGRRPRTRRLLRKRDQDTCATCAAISPTSSPRRLRRNPSAVMVRAARWRKTSSAIWTACRCARIRRRAGIAPAASSRAIAVASRLPRSWCWPSSRRCRSRCGRRTWRGNRRISRASRPRDFLESLFAPIRYGIAASKQPTLDELLARGVAKLEHSPQLEPGERVDLLAMFSRLYENLGEIPQSRRLAEQAVAFSDRALSPSDINAIRALTARGYAAVRDEDYAAGGADLRLAHWRMQAQGIHGEALIDLLEPLAAVENIEGHGEAALKLTREALEERIATWGPDDPRVGTGYNDVASELEGLERYAEAIPMWQKTYHFELAHYGPDSNETTLAMAGWASA